MKVAKKSKEKGVSEVVGSILVLLITVTLFSSIFYYVSNMPTPKQGIYTEFNAQIVLVNVNGQTYANITIKNVGGESLRTSTTMFIVMIESSIHRYYLSQGNIGVQPFAQDGKFSQGESFYYNSSWDGETVTPSTNVYVMLYDTSNSRVIWSQRLQGQANLPPIVIGVMTQPSPIEIGKYGKIMAIVFDPDPQDDISTYKVGVDLSSLSEGSYVKMTYGGGNIFTTSYIYFGNQSLDPRRPYKITVYVEDNLGRNESFDFYVYITKGTEVSGPDIYIAPNFIVMSTLNPTHEGDVTVTVTVQNRGGTGALFKLEVLDIYKSYPSGELIQTSLGNPIPSGNNYFTVAAAGQTTVTFIWEDVGTNSTGASLGPVAGYHQLLVKAIDISDTNGNPGEDPNAKYPDEAYVNLTVLPKILFVDADQSVEGTTNDVSRYYKYILETCSYTYDTKTILGDTVLTYEDYLKNYDLVIWETGYYGDPSESTSSAISSEQMYQLQQFYLHGGSIWLISSGVYYGYLNTYFGMNAATSTYDGTITGVSNPDIDLHLPSGALVSDTLVNDRSSNITRAKEVVYVTGGANALITGGTMDLGVYKQSTSGGKLVYIGFEFSRIKHYYNQNFIAYRILLWLGNLTGRAGVDVAVDDMILSTNHPLYMEPVNITVIVSNNGDSEVATQVMLKIDGVMSNDIVTPNPNSTGVIPPDGGFVMVNFTWIPTVPGKHVLTVYADPYNVLKETNEENNILNGNVVDNIVYVEFSTLLIYNDTYSYDKNLTAVEQAFDDLGYAYKVLNLHDGYPDGYLDGTYFTSYNLVIWVQTANLSTTNIPITNNDAQAIIRSLGYANIGFMFFGSRMPELMENAYYNGQNLADFFGITVLGNSVQNGEFAIFGINNPGSITNGLAYVVRAGSGESGIDDLQGEYGLFRNPISATSTPSEIEKTYDITGSIPPSGYGVITKSASNTKAIVLPIDPANIIGIVGMRYNDTPWAPARQARAELLFHALKYFGQEDSRPELAVYAPEIRIDYSQPIHKLIVSHTYMLRATIYNYGQTGASTLVRFYDDYEWIGTKSVYVAADSYITIEIAWTPMFAGHARHIRVIVDPLNQVKEIQNTSASSKELFNYNNEAIKTVTVWYFWDNMEHGDENWMHEATVLNINGETPLDFVDRKDVSTNVVGDWDWSLSGSSDNAGNFYKDLNIFYTNDTRVSNFTNGAHHTAPSAFWMPEAPRVSNRKPVDVIFVIDTSGSMLSTVPGANVGDVNGDGYSNTRIDVAIKAAEDAISELGDQDRVAIFVFNQNGNGDPEKLLDFTYTTQANIQNVIDPALEGLRATGGTPMYDTTADAVQYMDDYGRSDAVKGLLLMTDGLSNSDDQYYKYAPGTGSYEEEPGPIQYYTNGNGLLKIPYSIMAISIAPDAWDGRLFPLGNSSTGNVSMALFESKPDAIEGAFTTFISLLTQTASTGGIRVIPPQPITLSTPHILTTTISSLGAVVFSDGFRDTTWGSPGWTGSWTQSGFSIASTNDGNYYYKSQSAGWTDEYWVAQTSTAGAYMEHTVYPYDVLHYHYPGSYTIVGANISFWVGINYDDWYWPDATINVYAGGTLIATLSDVINGGTTDVIGSNYKIDYQDKYEAYCYVELPPNIVDLNSYDIKIEVQSTNDVIGIDDVMVVYYIDYTPPSSGGTIGGSVPQQYLNNINTHMNYTFLITPPVDMDGAKRAKLTFWTKYWMTDGTNGGIMYLWGSDDGTTWTWDSAHRYYLIPKQSYTGNLKFSAVDANLNTGGPNINGQQTGLIDADGNHPYWCFNGRSSYGTFGWDYIEVDLTPYLSEFRYIRIVFLLVQVGGLSPSLGWNPAMGWYLDDVHIEITSDNARDLWQLHDFGGVGNTKAHSGRYAWEYNVSDTSNLPPGVDSSLITKQIDLTTARTVNLIFWIRFNINNGAGVPPATIRVEVSSDNGATWKSITYGVRIGWNASGTDTILHNGKSYSGIPDTNFDGIPDPSSAGTYGWVESTTLMRVNCDLSGWAGETILLRFRVVTNATINPSTNTYYPTYDTNHPDDPYGVFIDDVFIYGESYSQIISAPIIWE